MLDFKKYIITETLALKGSYKGTIFQRLVAAKYMLSPQIEQSAIPAFQELGKKIERQNEFLKSKFTFEPTTDDPYNSMKSMTQSIDHQRRAGVKRPFVKVYDSPPKLGTAGAGHPIYSNDQNTIQRGVHDVIAHYFGQHPFSARGEYGAYNRHLKTLCNQNQAKSGGCLAAKAMFTEVVAQTSCFYVYGNYVEQKAIILEDFDHYHIGALHPTSPLTKYFELSNKQLIKKPDFDEDSFLSENTQLATELLNQTKGKPLTKLQPIFSQEF